MDLLLHHRYSLSDFPSVLSLPSAFPFSHITHVFTPPPHLRTGPSGMPGCLRPRYRPRHPHGRAGPQRLLIRQGRGLHLEHRSGRLQAGSVSVDYGVNWQCGRVGDFSLFPPPSEKATIVSPFPPPPPDTAIASSFLAPSHAQPPPPTRSPLQQQQQPARGGGGGVVVVQPQPQPAPAPSLSAAAAPMPSWRP